METAETVLACLVTFQQKAATPNNLIKLASGQQHLMVNRQASARQLKRLAVAGTFIRIPS
jgi:hypothetical protein